MKSFYAKARTRLMKTGWVPYYGGQRYAHPDIPGMHFYIRCGKWFLFPCVIPGDFQDVWGTGAIAREEGDTYSSLVCAANELQEQRTQ
jgi:hypothetical protein